MQAAEFNTWEAKAMIDFSDRRYWPVLALLLFLNVLIFGCLLLMIMGKIAL